MSNSQYPHSLLVHLQTDFLRFFSQLSGKRMNSSVELGIRTDIKHFFYCSFRNNLPFALFVFHNNRHSAACKVKRNFIYLFIIIFQILQRKLLDVRKNRFIHQILQSGLKEAVKISMAQNTLVIVTRTIRIDILLQHNLIACQCTSLIGTKNIHSTEILNGI